MRLPPRYRKYLPLALVVPGALLGLWLAWRAFLGNVTELRHEAFITPNSSIRLVLCGAPVQGYVSDLAPQVLKLVPGLPRLSSMAPPTQRLDWLHYLPIEFTFIIDQSAYEQLDVTLFVRENEEGPDFAEVLNDSAFLYGARPVSWESGRIRRTGEGPLVATGEMPLSGATQEAVDEWWPAYAPAALGMVSGAHFLELAADNRNGALFAVHNTLSEYSAEPVIRALDPLLDVWRLVEELHFTGDLDGDNRFVLQMSVICGNTEADAAGVFNNALSAAVDAMNGAIPESWATTVTASVEISGNRLETRLTWTGFEPRLRDIFSMS